MTSFTFIDLFAGIGGFHQALTNLNGIPVFASEWDKNARLTYEKNFYNKHPELFDNKLFVGDITQVNVETIPSFNILTGGFPCQPFSGAGKREGFEDTRGTLFFNIAQILQSKQPEAFFLENVRGLLSHDEGKTFATISDTLEKLNYSFNWKIVKASDHNLPQHRPRLFMVGFHEKVADRESFNFPEPELLTLTMDSILKGKVTNINGGEKRIGYTLRVGGRGSGVHDRHNWDSYIVNGVERQLSLEEATRMQGFPESFVFPVSKTQAFKQLGNAVAVPAVEATAKKIIETLSFRK